MWDQEEPLVVLDLMDLKEDRDLRDCLEKLVTSEQLVPLVFL